MKIQKKKKVASYLQEQVKTEAVQGLSLEESIIQKQNVQLMEKSYVPSQVESSWNEWWEKSRFYHANPQNVLSNAKKPYVMVIPPPNVTGYLHIGHGLTSAIEDSLIRRKRMQGQETLYLPGVDHAGIATHTVVEKQLMKLEGKTRHELGREKFVEKVWEWKEKHGNRICEQLKRLGSSLDWDRFHFTMDDQLSVSVMEAFVELFNRGLIYRANRLVNWSCSLKTAISDIEVDHIDIEKPTKMQVPGHTGWYEFGVLVHFAYKLKEDPTQEIVVATTRIETMLGDTAIAVHPNDERYKKFHGKEFLHPFIPNRKIVLIADSILVDMSFGTGAVKITPAHDPNDYECALRHNLEFVNLFDDNGIINQNGGPYQNMKRFDCRQKILKDLEKLGLLKGITPNKMSLAQCSRSKDIVEPMLRPQWYVKTEEISKRMVEVVKSKQLEIYPEDFSKIWYNWLENPRDWCISRQLWWGHRIPAYLAKIKGQDQPESQTGDNWVVGRNLEEALAAAEKKFGKPRDQLELSQDEDVLDTWFSSALFPFSTMGWPNNTDDYKAFYPNSILETGHDILFFWVARMVMMGLLLIGKLPFKKVLLHPIIRDKDGRKMSKSLGNVVDPLEIIDGCKLEKLLEKLQEGNLDPKELKKASENKKKEFPEGFPECGSDALRFALLSYIMQSRDINLDIKRIIGYREFCNKIWNTFKFGILNFPENFVYQPETINFGSENLLNQWILIQLNDTVKEVNLHYEHFIFGQATQSFQTFWRQDLCDTYLEATKPILNGTNEVLKQQTRNVLFYVLETALRLLHPMMPYLTEELYQKLPKFNGKALSISISSYPEESDKINSPNALKQFTLLQQIARTTRQLSVASNLPLKARPEVLFLVLNNDPEVAKVILENNIVLGTLSNTKEFAQITNETEIPQGYVQDVIQGVLKIAINVKAYINVDSEISRIKKKIAENIQSINILSQKLQAKNYEEKVPLEVRQANQQAMEKLNKEGEELNKALIFISSLK